MMFNREKKGSCKHSLIFLSKISLLVFLYFSFFTGCKETCFTQGLIPGCPYTEPVWYPDGTVLGFNHQVVKSIEITNPCFPFHSVTFFDDSNGFWLVNKDGTNMRRVTTFQLNTASWSPDGKWIAFSKNGQICKMAFDGTTFDTLHIFTLTFNGANHFFPCWSPLGDSLYFDSDEQNPGKPFQIYKMASDGTGISVIGNRGTDSVYSRFPYCSPTREIIHIRGDSLSTYVFSMQTDGSQVRQLTYNTSPNKYINNPVYFNNYIFYQDAGIWRTNIDGSGIIKLCMSSTQGFSISKDGIIAYSDFGSLESSVVDKTHGVIWTMNIDGTNQQPLTFNIY
jgi:Tol biopolymer transport system component